MQGTAGLCGAKQSERCGALRTGPQGPCRHHHRRPQTLLGSAPSRSRRSVPPVPPRGGGGRGRPSGSGSAEDGGAHGAVLLGRGLGAALGGSRLPGCAGHLPALRTRDEGTISKAQHIITHLRKQKYNADYDLSATQSADALAFVSLLEEKLLPVLIHTFWVDAKNYVEHTRKWYAETIPFPLNFFLPNAMHKRQLERLQLLWGDDYMEDEEKLEKELYREARECLTLLSQRLGSQKFFFGDSPASLDALVFSRLAPLLKAKLPNGKLQQHLKSLQNLCNYCTSILSLYFPWDGGDPLTGAPRSAGTDGSEAEEDPHKWRNQLLSVLVGLAAMLGYAFLSGIVSIQRGSVGPAGRQPITLEEEEEEEE
ncbi:metaxin-1 isoform X1 [Corvus moneduloides]|uniref:metaxin-1 isoform X1 n=1 Tax=Corvus moneduloides TaxID=1196302 RepID=UPI0013636F0C|nr:metaxin-1 isoform X1 [Corvus moneduloides]